MSDTERYRCEQVFRLLDRYVDRTLTTEERRGVLTHLSACARCAAEYRFEATLVEEIRRKLRRVAAPPDIIQAIENELRNAPTVA